MISFAQPLWFLLLLLLVPMYLSYRRYKPAFIYSTLQNVDRNVKRNSSVMLSHLGFVLRCLALICFVFALARPQDGRSHHKQRTEGLDIMLVVDTSESMKALDFVIDGGRKDRLHVAKKVMSDFIDTRTDDRIGLTVFGTHAFAYVPLTLDHDVLQRYLSEVEIGLAGKATAIGDAIGVSVYRLKDIKSKSKVAILLTDGDNSSGKVDPAKAAEAAKTLGVKLYTIGIGSSGYVPFPTPMGYQKVKFELNEELLESLATKTGGRYFKASSTEALQKIYQTIDQLEKSEVEVKMYHRYEEKFAGFVWAGLLFLLLELMFNMSKFRRIP